MEAREMDKVIKERLYNHESEVRDDSWAKLEFILDSKENKPVKGLVYWRSIAAVLLLVSVSWLGFKGISYWMSVQQWRSEISQLVLERYDYKRVQLNGIIEPLSIVKQSSLPHVSIKKVKHLVKEPLKVIHDKETLVANQEEEGPYALPIEKTVKQTITYETVEIEEPLRIVYKRSTDQFDKPKQDSLKTSLVKDLFNATREFQPGELLADMRSAKDKMLKNPFGINNNIKNLNRKK